MTIAEYIESIVGGITSPALTYYEGKVWEANWKLDQVSVFPVVFFRNFLTASYTMSQSGRILYADYPISVEFLQKQDELDQEGSDIDSEIIDTLTPIANEFIKRIYLSAQFQDVAEQTNNQTWNSLYFRDRYDVIVAGLELNGTIRLILDETICL